MNKPSLCRVFGKARSLVLMLLSITIGASLADAADTQLGQMEALLAKRISYETMFLPLNEQCEQYYSLYEPGKVCIKERLYFRVFDVVYEFRGQQRKARLTFIPEEKFRVYSNGEVMPRNHQTRPE